MSKVLVDGGLIGKGYPRTPFSKCPPQNFKTMTKILKLHIHGDTETFSSTAQECPQWLEKMDSAASWFAWRYDVSGVWMAPRK